MEAKNVHTMRGISVSSFELSVMFFQPLFHCCFQVVISFSLPYVAYVFLLLGCLKGYRFETHDVERAMEHQLQDR
jgi:hypothetical protein